MDASTIKTSGDAARVLAETKAKLEVLQAEENDAAWLASQDERSQLERDVSALEQLHKRHLDREERARIAALERAVEENRAIVDAPSPIFEKLAEHVAESATKAAQLLAELYEDDRKRYGAFSAMARAQEQLGIRPQNPPTVFFPPLARIRARVWSALDQAKLHQSGGALVSVYQPEPPEPPPGHKATEALWQNIPRSEAAE